MKNIHSTVSGSSWENSNIINTTSLVRCNWVIKHNNELFWLSNLCPLKKANTGDQRESICRAGWARLHVLHTVGQGPIAPPQKNVEWINTTTNCDSKARISHTCKINVKNPCTDFLIWINTKHVSMQILRRRYGRWRKESVATLQHTLEWVSIDLNSNDASSLL